MALLTILADAALKGVLLLALAAALAAAMRRSSAAARHLVWSAALACLVALPVLSGALPSWQTPILPGSLAPAPFETAGDANPVIITMSQSPGMPASHAGAPAHTIAFAQVETVSWAAWVMALWAAGALAVLAPWVLGAIAVRRLARGAHPPEDRSWQATLDRAAADVGLARGVRLLISPRVGMPMAWGILRPVILMPVRAGEWSAEERRAVLLHELSHVKRLDCLTQLAARAACALYWFNPFVHLAAGKQHDERERACDDRVLAAGQKASEYAAQLLAIARQVRPARFAAVAAVAMARPSRMEGRLLAILDATRSRRAMTRAAATAAILIAAAVAVPLACVRVTAVEDKAAAPAAPAADPKAKAALVAAKPGAVAEPPWRVTLPSGITVALIGVSENPSQGKPWWRPDGSTLAHAPDLYPSFPEPPLPDLIQPANEFAILLTDMTLPSQQGDFEVITRIEPTPPLGGNGATGTTWVSSRLWEPSGTTKGAHTKGSQLYVLSQSFPPSQDHATIKVGLAAGPWNTITAENIEGRRGRSSSVRGILGTDIDVSFAEPYEQEKSVFITVAHNVPPDQQVRAVAVLADGKEVAGGWNPQVANGHVQQITQSFGGISIKDVVEFRVQARPFQWAEFKNVPLRPRASPAPKTPTAVSSAPASDAQFFAELGYKDAAPAAQGPQAKKSPPAGEKMVFIEARFIDVPAKDPKSVDEAFAKAGVARPEDAHHASIVTEDQAAALRKEIQGLPGASLLSAPRLLAYEGREARISIASRIPVTLPLVENRARFTTAMLDTGVFLEVVPETAKGSRDTNLKIASRVTVLLEDRKNVTRESRTEADLTVPEGKWVLLHAPAKTYRLTGIISTKTDPQPRRPETVFEQQALDEVAKDGKDIYILVKPQIVTNVGAERPHG